MIALLTLAVLAAAVWALWAPALAFASGFASLLQRPVQKTGLWPFVAGLETVGGEYRGRSVLLLVHHKRGRHSLGYLVLAMRPQGGDQGSLPSVRESVQGTAARQAWDDLELHHKLTLSFADGWMKATWQPFGLMIFPGRFEPDRWRTVLQSMHAVVTSLEPGEAKPGPSEAEPR